MKRGSPLIPNTVSMEGKKIRKKVFCTHYGSIKLISTLLKLEKILENWRGGNFSHDVNSTKFHSVWVSVISQKLQRQDPYSICYNCTKQLPLKMELSMDQTQVWFSKTTPKS